MTSAMLTRMFGVYCISGVYLLLINKSFAEGAPPSLRLFVLSFRQSIYVSPAANVSDGHLLLNNPHATSSLCVCP